MTDAPTPRAGRRRRTPLLFVPAMMSAALVLLSACAGGNEEGDASPSRSTPDTEAAAPADFDYAEDAPVDAPASEEAALESVTTDLGQQAEADGASPAVPTALTPADLGRDIVYRATIIVQADDVTAASNEAVAIVQGLGGIVFNQTTRTEPRPSAEITFKVLPDDFRTALGRLAGMGKLVDRSISADDVTERVVDLESRISTAETSVTRLRRLLEEAGDLEDVAQIERELLDRETTLEVLRGQLRTLRGQVDLSTITLTIHQSPTVLPDTGIEVGAWISDDADDPCLGTEHLTADPDSTVYICLEVENTGASALTDVSVRSRYVRLDVDDFETRQGRFERIEPGGLLVAVLEVPVIDGRLAGRVASRGLEIGLEVEATPVDAQGAALQEVSAEAGLWLDIPADESLPGFLDSISDGAGFLRTVVGVVLVVVGVLVPFLPFAAVIAALIWWRRRRRGGTRSEPTPKPERTPKRERTPRFRRKRAKAEAPAPPPPASEADGSDDSQPPLP
ncbi:MAG: DUF4349 domain-containing protein [Acidimicrobiaceae bacterium]|nr:DUF4349 domain-containing protein [Acidimicrobiaceae bacterium]